MSQVIQDQYKNGDAIIGVATGAVAIAALSADLLNLPLLYVRSSPKEHGLGNRIEGDLDSFQHAVILEDLVSTGKSSLNAVRSVRESGKEVLGMVSIFDYGFSEAVDNFNAENCTLFSLADYTNLMQAALEKNYVDRNQIAELELWRDNPDSWKRQ